jgi:hypothetical protein
VTRGVVADVDAAIYGYGRALAGDGIVVVMHI